MKFKVCVSILLVFVVLIIVTISLHCIFKRESVSEYIGSGSIILTVGRNKVDRRSEVVLKMLRKVDDSKYKVLKLVSLNGTEEELDSQPQNIAFKSPPNQPGAYGTSSQEIVIVMVSCGHRFPEAYHAIKSAILFTNSPLKIIVFLEDEFIQQFKDVLNEWRNKAKNKFAFELYRITYPKTENTEEWVRLVITCASQRLFFPSILRDTELVLFVDEDVLFTRPLEEVWYLFSVMNETQEVAMATECDLPYGGYYHGMAEHPYFMPGGLNAGVMLMNMTRMRQNLWTRHIVKYYHTYKHQLHAGDQDLINIYLEFHRERALVLNSRYNFRPHKSYCDETLGVREAAVIGASILHGTLGGFYVNAPIFQRLYMLWKEYEVGSDPYTNVYLPLKIWMEHSNETICESYFRIFLTGMEAQFQTTTTT